MAQATAEVTLTNSSESDVPGRIGKYEIINDLGQGSSGRVFLSHDPYYGRDVAIKVLPEEFTSHPDRLERFEREAMTLVS